MYDARNAYIETQIKTATPQKLRLMLIQGALRFANQACEGHASADRERISAGLDRARDIVAELLSGIRPDRHPLNDVARDLYAFIYKSLAEAQLLDDVQKIRDAIRVLEEERITWEQVCETMPEPPTAEATSNFRGQEVVAGDFSPIAAAPARFSLDA